MQINFPDANKKSDVVTMRGPKAEVDKCHKYLTELVKDLVSVLLKIVDLFTEQVCSYKRCLKTE